jgi:hypothetical protein
MEVVQQAWQPAMHVCHESGYSRIRRPTDLCFFFFDGDEGKESGVGWTLKR